MWLFTDYGYLLPVLTPENDPLRREKGWDKYSHDGEFTFQVRARLREHLEYYLEHFGEPGTYGEIWKNPTHDYNYRVMTTQEAFAEAMKKSILAIDYRHFKDQSLKYPRGKEYHDLLISVWSASTKLNAPGGVYGEWSESNPDGYRKASRYGSSWGAGVGGRRIGDSFDNIDFGDDDEYNQLGHDLPDPDDDSLNYVSEKDRKKFKVIDELDAFNIPMSDWAENTSPSEFELVYPELKKAFNKKALRAMRNRNRHTWSGK